MKKRNQYERTTQHIVRGAKYAPLAEAFYEHSFVVRITANEYGMTMSIADEPNGGMYAIPLEPIAKRLREILNRSWH